MGAGGAARRVLIVEDEADLAAVLAAAVAYAGYEPVVSVDGAAVEAARRDPPALVLLDVQMPGMDGPQVCRRLKADPRTAHVPVVFVTALAPAILRAQLGDCPHEGVLHKPFALEKLLAAVRRHLP